MTQRKSHIIIRPRCEADMRKCKAIVRIYRRNEPTNNIKISNDEIRITQEQHFYFIGEFEGRVLEWFQGDYRLCVEIPKSIEKKFMVPDEDRQALAGKEFDMWFPDDTPFYEYRGFAFVLRFEAPPNFKSTCI